MASWGEELWDTSMALISLNRLGLSQKDPQYQKAISWMVSLYNMNNRQNWHDEPWETSWCILAILETDTIPELSDIAYKATKWLLSLQDSEGKIVSPHYTAYFILSSSKLINYDWIISQEDKKIISDAIDNAIKFLLGIISKDALWTGEAWSNGQILWALANTGKFPCSNKDILLTVVNWFADHQESDGNWSDVEDTASSILGLYYLLRELESMSLPPATDTDTIVFNNLRRYLDTPVLCLKRKFIENHEDGTTSINLSPMLKKLMAIIAAIASGATVVLYLSDFIKGLLGW